MRSTTVHTGKSDRFKYHGELEPAAPCEAGTAGPAPHRVVPGSQPTQCNTLGLARGSGPFEPPMQKQRIA